MKNSNKYFIKLNKKTDQLHQDQSYQAVHLIMRACCFKDWQSSSLEIQEQMLHNYICRVGIIVIFFVLKYTIV